MGFSGEEEASLAERHFIEVSNGSEQQGIMVADD